ncbi:hypothetical protein A499_11236, partial [Niallia nealsonii AAU1]
MQIDKIEVQHVKMPLVSPFETSFGKLLEKDFLIIKI